MLLCLGAGYSTAAANFAGPIITKVEPPSWWINHTINPVRLLIRGQNLASARVIAGKPGIATSGVRINQAGTYLFVDVTVGPGAKPGVYPINIQTPAGRTTFQFTINTPLDSRANFQGITNNDVIYLIMTDRFANGDKGNDQPADAPARATDRKNPRAYHGGDLRGVIDHLGYMKELGVTAIWLTPWYDNWNGISDCDRPWCPSTYYHGYHTIDYYGVEDRFGDLATLKELVEKAHALGLKVIQDQVANHVGAHHPWATDSPLDNWFHGTMQNHERERFQNYVLLSPHGNPADVRNTLDGWFSDDMPDMNQDEPEVARYEIQNSLWWIGTTGIDGIRQDTIQYIPRSFIRDLSNALHRQYAHMWMVGEVFERDAAQTAFFIGGHKGWDGVDTQLDSVFDFSLWNVSLEVFTRHASMRALPNQLKYDALYPEPARVTTLVNNHDTQRFMSLPGATLEGAMLHTAFTLTVRGTPQLYAGEEIAMEGKEDPDNRRDFPGGFSGDNRNAFTASGRSRDEQRMWQWTHDWLALRRQYSALRVGKLIDLFVDDESYAYVRQDASGQTVVVVINRDNDARKISLTIPGIAGNATLNPIFGKVESAVVSSGAVSLSVPSKTAVAYIVAGGNKPR